MSATVIIPTTGSPEVKKAIQSVLDQTYQTTCYVVCDGEEHMDAAMAVTQEFKKYKKLKFAALQLNVGAKGFYGHRIYAAFPHLVDTEFVLFLDQDNWLDPDHVLSCVHTIRNGNLQWAYSLRKIVDKDGNFLINDDCESLGKWASFQGYNHVDTNAYCIPTVIATKICQVWHGGWGQDRIFLQAMSQHFPNYDTTGKYSVNYRLDGNPGSVTKEFFEQGNKTMAETHGEKLPWRK